MHRQQHETFLFYNIPEEQYYRYVAVSLKRRASNKLVSLRFKEGLFYGDRFRDVVKLQRSEIDIEMSAAYVIESEASHLSCL